MPHLQKFGDKLKIGGFSGWSIDSAADPIQDLDLWGYVEGRMREDKGRTKYTSKTIETRRHQRKYDANISHRLIAV